MIVVAGSTPLIALAKIGQFNLLYALFQQIFIPEAVFHKVASRGSGRPGAEEIRESEWIQVRSPSDMVKVTYLLSDLDQGEAEALVLAEEISADWILIDETKARLAAEFMGLKYIGTVGLLLLAKQAEMIPAVRPLLDELRNQKFQLAERTYQAVLRHAGE